MTKLLELLNLILSFGPKLQPVMDEVMAIVEAIQRIVALVNKPKFAAAKGKPLNARESAAAAKITAALGGKAKFGGVFTTIFAFLKANPWLVDALLLLLKSKKQ